MTEKSGRKNDGRTGMVLQPYDGIDELVAGVRKRRKRR